MRSALAGPVFLFAVWLPVSAQTDYLPLNTGNVWIYSCNGFCANNPTLTLEISGSDQFGGKTYYRLEGFRNQTYWLRQAGDGSVYAYDRNSGQEQLWYAFQTPEGQEYKTELPSCCGRAVIDSRSATYQGPIGQFNYALAIRYPGVFQVGIANESFLPYVGMVQREERMGGPATAYYNLIYARLGDVTVVSQPEIAFGISLGQITAAAPRDPPGTPPAMVVRLTVRNSLPEPVTVTFPTCQIYDLEIRDDKGKVVYRWSQGKAFCQALQTIAYSGEKNYAVSVPLTGADGNALAAGRYVAEGWLAADDPRVWRASASLEIK
jgi:hypothetical protein